MAPHVRFVARGLLATTEAANLTPPFSQTLCDAVVLLADVSGFSALEERFEATQSGKQFSELLNGVLGSIELEVLDAGGEVVHLAGDALICVFAPDLNRRSTRETYDAVRTCALRIIRTFAQVHSVQQPGISVHGGFARGDITVVHLRDGETRRHLTVCGDAIERAVLLLDRSQRGEFLGAFHREHARGRPNYRDHCNHETLTVQTAVAERIGVAIKPRSAAILTGAPAAALEKLYCPEFFRSAHKETAATGIYAASSYILSTLLRGTMWTPWTSSFLMPHTTPYA